MDDEIFFLNDLMNSLRDSEMKLEDYYNRKDYRNFDQTKNFMLKILNKIMKIIE